MKAGEQALSRRRQGLPLFIVSVAVDQQHGTAHAAKQRRLIARDKLVQQSGVDYDLRSQAVAGLRHRHSTGAAQLVHLGGREIVVPVVAHGAGGGAGRGDRGGLRRRGPQADPATQAVAVESEPPVAERLREGDRGVQVVDLSRDGQDVVVALAAAAEVEGQRGVARAGQRRFDERKAAPRAPVAGEAVGHDDERSAGHAGTAVGGSTSGGESAAGGRRGVVTVGVTGGRRKIATRGVTGGRREVADELPASGVAKGHS